jgi:hypothetical protein
VADNSTVYTLWQGNLINSGDSTRVVQVPNAQKLEYHIHVRIAAGTSGTLTMEQTGSPDEPGGWAPMGTARSLTSATNYTEGFDHFLPYVRFTASNVVGTTPVVTVFLIVRP